MTANLRLVGKNVVDDTRCVLSCSVAEVLPLINVQNRARGRILRVAAASGVEVKGTYGGDSVRATMASLRWFNFESDATWRFQGYSDAAWTTLVIDTGDRAALPSATLGYLDFGIAPLGSSLFDPYYGQKFATVWFDDASMVKFDTEVIASWKITMTDPTNTSGYMDVSRAWVGKHYELASNPEYGAAFGWVDESQSWRTDGGGQRNDAALPFRGGRFDAQQLPEADRAALMDISRFCGAGVRSFLMSLFPSNASPAQTRDHEMEAVFKNPLPQLAINETEGGRFNTAVTVEEV